MGQSCQLSFHDDSGAGQWWRVSEESPYTPPRTGSAGVYLSSTGAMYLFGGEIDTLLISTVVVVLIFNEPTTRLFLVNSPSFFSKFVYFMMINERVFVWFLLLSTRV